MKLSVRYYLSQPNKEKSLIISSITCDGIRVRTSIGLTIPTKYWNKTTQLVKNTHPNSGRINKRIREYYNNVEGAIYLLDEDNLVSKEKLTDIAVAYSYTDNNQSKGKSKYLVDFFEGFIEHCKSSGLKEGSIRYYRAIFKDFRIYEEWRKKRIKLNHINKNLMNEYTSDYLMNHKKSSNNTAVSYYNIIKGFLKYLENEKSIKLDSSYSQIKIKGHQSRELTITINEFNSIMKVELQHKDIHHQNQLELIRDRFILSVLTGLRNSDINQIKPSLTPIIDSDGQQSLIYYSAKTKSQIRIPLIGVIKEILERNNFNLKVFTPSLANYYLKELFKIAGIDRPFTKSVVRNRERIEETKPAYEFAGTHTGRRSTVTILRGLGIPNTMIMQVTTHKDESMILRYDNTEQKTAVNEVYKAFENAMNKETA